MRRRLVATLRFVVLLPLVVAAAQAAEPARRQEPLAVQLTRFIMPEENWRATMEGLSAQVKQMADANAKQLGAEPSPDAVAGLVTDLMTDLMTYQELVDVSASVFAKHYTEAELAELLAFYRTPLGQKIIRKQPECLQDINGQTIALVQRRLPALMEKLAARMSKQVEASRPTSGSAKGN